MFTHRVVSSRLRRVSAAGLLVFAMLAVLMPAASAQDPEPLPDVFISELHYDNSGADEGEFIELTGPAGTDLMDWSIVLYNGNGGAPYNTIDLAGNTIDDEDGTSGAVSFAIAGIQNGGPDGIALIGSDGSLVEFLSYEGSFTAVGGPADGATSEDVGVSEPSSTAIGDSLQLIDGVWTGPSANSAGSLNTGAQPSAPQPFISEIHYDNVGADVDEFFELSGPANFDLAGWTVLLYNGSNGTAYATLSIAEAFLNDEDGTSGTIELNPTVGLQNGSPDGIALIDPDGEVVEFLSYEGTMTATSGAAAGLTSVDIGVEETSSTPVGQSLQLVDGVWIGPAPASPGMLNTAVVIPPATVLISEIQGPGDSSPVEGLTVRFSGIVVGDFQDITTNDPTDAPLDGFFVQEEDIHRDGSDATSEGVFVYDPGGTAVAVGDLVTVTGTVSEFFGLTEVTAVSDITIESSGNPLPTPAMPTLPTAVGDAAVDWEFFEGMSVLFNQPLYVTGTFPLGRYGEVQLSAIGPQDHPNQTNDVGSSDAAAQRQLNLDSRVILDDGEDENESFPSGIPTWNPDPTPYLGGPDNTLRSGDAVNNLAGVVHYAWNEFEIHPVNTLDETDPDGAVSITRTPRPASAPDVGGSLQVASFNVLNYFTTIDTGGALCGPAGNQQGCRGADTQAEFDVQSAKIATAIAGLDADIVGLIEIENSGTGAPIADLVAKVNALSSRTYDYVATGFVGTDAIAVGYIYDSTTVAPQGDFALLDSSVSPAFIDNKNRPVLAQTWVEFETGATLTTAVGHLKSKGSSCDDVSNPGDAAFGVAPYALGVDIEDPNFQGNCNLTRTAAAQILGQWLASNPTGTPSSNLLLLGDLNAYANEDPITALAALGYTDLHAAGGTSWAAGGHSYVFDGEHGTLDYALANPAILPFVTGAEAWHINADEPFAIDYQDFNPAGQAQLDEWKSSDHDPTIVGLQLAPPEPGGDALMVVGNVSASGRPPSKDRPVLALLESLGFDVELVNDDTAVVADAAGKDLVVVSSSVVPSKIGDLFADVPAPVVTWEGYLFDDFGFTPGPNGATGTSQTNLTIVDPSHPIAAGYSDSVAVSTAAERFAFAEPVASAQIVGAIGSRPVVFAFEAGASLVDGAAPARRVGLFMNYRAAGSLTKAGSDIVAAAIVWATGGTPGVPVNVGPTVEAGESALITLPVSSVALDATVSDDGLPAPSNLTYEWSLFDGPAAVSFTDSTSEDTEVSFTAAGQYTLMLTASDGVLSDSDLVIVTVLAEPAEGTQIAYVSSRSSLPSGDRPIRDRFEANGAVVTVVDDDALLSSYDQFDLIFLSTSVVYAKIGDHFADVAVPVISTEQYLFDDMNMAGPQIGVRNSATIDIQATGHPLAAGFSGTVTITTTATNLGHGQPGPGAAIVATVSSNPVYFGYELGDEMINGVFAPATRVAFPGTFPTAKEATNDYFELLDAAVAFALGAHVLNA